MTKLSILICSVQKRLTKLSQLIEHLHKQADGKPVEILWLGDTKTMSVGEKRNKLLSLAKGAYVCFIDDDDWTSDDYVASILKALESNPDAVGFEGSYSNEVTGIKNHVYYMRGNKNSGDELKGERYRPIMHLNPVKRDHALAIKFDEINFGEDAKYAALLWNSGRLRTVVEIKRVLYYYRFSPLSSETHGYNPAYKQVAAPVNPMVKMDVVFVSDGSTPELHKMTSEAIGSIIAEDVNIIVVEKSNKVKYICDEAILQKQPFNYNQCLNEGAKLGNAEFICFSNNDVLFPPHFVAQALEILKGSGCDVLSFTNQHGFIHREIISGFCFIMRRDAWQKIGKLNEEYKFWCADNVTSEQIKKHGLKELKCPIRVHHICSVSLNKLEPATKNAYTVGCVQAFNRDYDKNVLNMGKAPQPHVHA